jgi:hypothetical protein
MLALLALAHTAAPVFAQQEGSTTAMMPPGTWNGQRQAWFEQWFGKHLRAMEEPALWPQAARAGFVQRDRLLVLPSFSAPVAVRIDRKADGSAVAVVTQTDGHGGYGAGKVAVRRSIALTPAALRPLDAAIAEAKLWDRPTEPANPALCTDGTRFVFEHADGSGDTALTRHGCDVGDAVAAVIAAWLKVGQVEEASEPPNLVTSYGPYVVAPADD